MCTWSSHRPRLPQRLALVFAIAMFSTLAASAVEAQGHGRSDLPHGIPDFAAKATIRAVQSGPWSEPRTWSGGQVPPAGAVVRIPRGVSVTYDVVSDSVMHAIGVEGALVFRTDGPTRLVAGVLQVMPTGRLEVGREDAPVPAGVKAEIVIADQRLDVSSDPEQFGAGLIGLGTIRMHGAVVAPTFVRLGREPKAGDQLLTLAEAPSEGWDGARLILPGTNQPVPATEPYRPQWEELTSAGSSALTLRLSAPLKFEHRGARDADATLEFLPHVGNLSRNVIVKSANPGGTRGHVIFVHRADVDIRYTLFKDLGRTTIQPLDSTVLEGGHPAKIGKNQIGRYSLHMHHLTGPESVSGGRAQFTLIGNAIDGGSKWGITVHNSHFGVIRDNVVYDVGGAGLVTEDGSETGNVFDHNFVVRAWGTGGDRADERAANGDWGYEGSAFWFRGPNNAVRNNVGANTNSFAVTYMMIRVGGVRVPNGPGADPASRAHRVVDMNKVPLGEFANNEVYASFYGLTIWDLGAVCCADIFEVQESTVKNFRLWHIGLRGYYGYASNRLTFDGWVQRGDGHVLTNPHERATGFYFGDYLARHTVIRNADVQGLRTGVVVPMKAGDRRDVYGSATGTLDVEDSLFRNDTNIVATTPYGVVGGGESLPPRRTTIRNVRFGPVNPASTADRRDIVMLFEPANPNANPIVKDEVLVVDYNGTPGDTFQVYYKEQASGFVVPGSIAGPAAAGLTNAEAWKRHQMAVAGAVAPCADSRSAIVGLACPLVSGAVMPDSRSDPRRDSGKSAR